MAAYFRLFYINDENQEFPLVFSEVDDKMRKALGQPPSTTEWYKGWYDLIGLALATGHDLNWCRKEYDNIDDVIDWLEKNTTSSCWRGR